MVLLACSINSFKIIFDWNQVLKAGKLRVIIVIKQKIKRTSNKALEYYKSTKLRRELELVKRELVGMIKTGNLTYYYNKNGVHQIQKRTSFS